ncbi:YihY/virulence factor BrkB family protein [Paenibacillus sp. J2TS4]|uniref:YihY/virulence factor BrkB family protein n=1 Tax=Paenibacillus sp. J2TS4 TaxID=2807194 RepID=UPI001B0F426C|nr:YihY/virulence factor BrkB family protein [Paenibacillus sp. J2TS4]GIP35684.1 hypothetical protein J2TS4_48940 [Paenibacillus sp. J2TS4]
MKRSIQFLVHLYTRFQDNEVPALGAQMTFYLILSFFPFLIFMVSLVAFMPISPDEMIESVAGILPQLSADLIANYIQQLKLESSGALLSIGMVATIWSASKGTMAIMKGLNKAYNKKETRPYWKVRGISILFTLLLAMIIIFCLVLLIFGKVIGERLFASLLMPEYFMTVWNMAKYAFPLGIMSAVFMILYKLSPNRKMTWKETIPGALFTTVSWVVVSLLFSFYVNHFASYSKTYGSIGGMIVFLIWLYMSSTIIVIGGEINATLAFEREGKVRTPDKLFPLQLPWTKNNNRSS